MLLDVVSLSHCIKFTDGQAWIVVCLGAHCLANFVEVCAYGVKSNLKTQRIKLVCILYRPKVELRGIACAELYNLSTIALRAIVFHLNAVV